MASSDEENKIVLYHYSASPYAKRIVWYLALRDIPYVQCVSRHFYNSHDFHLHHDLLLRGTYLTPCLPTKN